VSSSRPEELTLSPDMADTDADGYLGHLSEEDVFGALSALSPQGAGVRGLAAGDDDDDNDEHDGDELNTSTVSVHDVAASTNGDSVSHGASEANSAVSTPFESSAMASAPLSGALSPTAELASPPVHADQPDSSDAMTPLVIAPAPEEQLAAEEEPLLKDGAHEMHAEETSCLAHDHEAVSQGVSAPEVPPASIPALAPAAPAEPAVEEAVEEAVGEEGEAEESTTDPKPAGSLENEQQQEENEEASTEQQDAGEEGASLHGADGQHAPTISSV
jgi:hypothetical protein